MSGHLRDVASWWQRADDPIRCLLLFTGAGLVIIALALALKGFFLDDRSVCPQPGDKSCWVPDDSDEAIAEALERIEKTLLSVVVKLDEGQWEKIETGFQEAATGVRKLGDDLTGTADGIATEVKKISDKVDDIATGVQGAARRTANIEIGVEKVAGKAEAIAANVQDVARRTANIEIGVEKVAGKAEAIAANVQDVARRTANIEIGVEKVTGKAEAIVAGVQDVARRTADIEIGVEKVTGKAEAIAASVQDVARRTANIEIGVEKVAGKAEAIAAGVAGVQDVARRTANIEIGMVKVAGKAEAIAANVQDVARRTANIEIGMVKVAGKAEAIAANVQDVARRTANIEIGVEKVAGRAEAIAANVQDVARRTANIEIGMVKVAGKAEDVEETMKRPWACKDSRCVGAVHFPHDWPPKPDNANDRCNKWESENIVPPIRNELKRIVDKLNKSRPSLVWIVGHASTLGGAAYNRELSKRRAQFVKFHLKNDLKSLNVRFETCFTGEKESADSLRHPDSWYRVVHVFSEQPPQSWCPPSRC